MEDNYTVVRKIKQQKLRRKARRGEIAMRRLYKLFRFIIIIIIFYSIYRISLAHYWYFPKDLYTKNTDKYIEILGNNIVPKSKIINEIKKIPIEKKPIYMINPTEAAKALEKLSPVKSAYVRRFWFPARYVIMLEEETPAIVIAPKEDVAEVAAFSYSGKLIGREYLPLNSNIKSAKVLSYGTKDDDYEKWNKEKIDELYKLYKELEEYSGESVEYIDLRIPHNAFVQLKSTKVKLGELDTSVYERIKALASIMPKIRNTSESIKYIDISWGESSYLKMNENKSLQ